MEDNYELLIKWKGLESAESEKLTLSSRVVFDEKYTWKEGSELKVKENVVIGRVPETVSVNGFLTGFC